VNDFRTERLLLKALNVYIDCHFNHSGPIWSAWFSVWPCANVILEGMEHSLQGQRKEPLQSPRDKPWDMQNGVPICIAKPSILTVPGTTFIAVLLASSFWHVLGDFRHLGTPSLESSFDCFWWLVIAFDGVWLLLIAFLLLLIAFELAALYVQHFSPTPFVPAQHGRWSSACIAGSELPSNVCSPCVIRSEFIHSCIGSWTISMLRRVLTQSLDSAPYFYLFAQRELFDLSHNNKSFNWIVWFLKQ
jgi:hypothetical protein